MDIKKVRYILVGICSFAVIFTAGFALGRAGFVARANDLSSIKISREVPKNKDVDFSLFWRVWDTLLTSYVDKTKINPSEMVYGAIKGMVASIGDPYTVFLTPDENKVTEEDLKGSFDGVGIQIGYRGTQLSVIAPLPGTPAEKAGVKAGDYILAIKDTKKDIEKTTSGMNLPEAVQLIRGTGGSHVILTLLRDGEEKPFDVDLVRESIDVPSVILTFVGENESVAHLRLLKFGAETKVEWDKAVNEIIRKSGVNKVIVDLRNNPGGYLQAAVDIAADFVPSGSTVVMEELGSGEKDSLKTTTQPRLSNYKVVILANKGSASASEILSGALRDVVGIKIIGENTFGKGTVQEPQQLEKGAGLHITIAKWLTPKGTWIHEKGLEPDITVEEKSETTVDEQLERAIKEISQ